MRRNRAGSGDRYRGQAAVRRRLMSMGLALVAALALAVVPAALASRTQLKPGWNLFSPDQDIEIGKKVSRDAEKQVPMLNDSRVDNYLNALGHRLSAHAPGYRYPYQYKCVNSSEINAFALPGGFIYINRGVFEAADDEAQLAGVVAHETSHVVLRHGTNQASKAYAAQVPLALLGGMLGSNSIGAVLGQLGAGFAINSIFLKYSRTDESQADIMGTQILYDTGYDPRAMAQFFEKIQAESKSRPVEFFSDHPNPEHRIERVTEEVGKLGGPPSNYKTDSQEFQAIKRYLKSLPPAPKSTRATGSGGSGGSSNPSAPQRPSGSSQNFQNSEVRLQYPDNWHSYGQGSAVTFAPDGGVVDDGQGNSALAYGLIVNVYEPHNDSGGQMSLEQATDQLVSQLQQSNPRMSVVRRHERMRLGGATALSTDLVNDSPAGGREGDWLVTTLRPNGLLFFVCVAPQSAAAEYEPAFQRIIDSVRFTR
jgi:Zn-dependent protease with chaperone function